MFLLIDNYDSFTYNLYALFDEAGVKVDIVKNDELVDASCYKGIIISPGPSNPENSGYSLAYIEKYKGVIPIFGVCLGMQCIAFYKTGSYRQAKSIKHGKIEKVIKTKDSLILDGIPERFDAVRYHSLAVNVSDDNVVAIAETDNEIMAIEYKDDLLFGVQFHPESIKSEFGDIIVKNFIKICGGCHV
ncbi:aminodeoxychorismate/anthranilate synthase component II [Deferribacter thermophilus]|uniref:anthranilate synthase component II n=1 Tax=Deferribacter thermophilus TaxID=53573 RepID=UPI003C1785D6